MTNLNVSNSSVMLSDNVGVIKKALDVQERDIMSILSSSSVNAPTQNTQEQSKQVAQLTGMGQNIDIKA
ncbi:hypothetical protein [Hydrogenimonas thermophila]|uniref:Motility protein n=1 Tax=Hydrogenimonas thermophila TaxID=223786 RepID=A0A1I5NF84_9BACT|nr:hypothetical protein [Hydrogenimonas thermophila]WOE69860.1 hypothetical protein RZR91_12240 [Hydrogenimonas thermophila]WOE72375.1 hypothetical protein RZR97_12235 [Hydrogenimonas thermophila]SFP20453.1 hypothetical protein SAMN05216234_11026 [Hydrogenimonas thermophila]